MPRDNSFCPWCVGCDDFEPFDSDDADAMLCRSHVAEFEGTSLDGLDRQDAAMRADMDALGFNDR